MRYEFIKPFVESTARVIDSVLDVDVNRGDLALSERYDLGGDISILIGMKGETEGSIIINMTCDTAVNIYNAMAMEDSGALSEMELDGLMELANMIAGNAVSVLNEMGFDLEVSPPLIITRGQLRPDDEGREVFLLPLYTDCGEIIMNVSMRTH